MLQWACISLRNVLLARRRLIMTLFSFATAISAVYQFLVGRNYILEAYNPQENEAKQRTSVAALYVRGLQIYDKIINPVIFIFLLYLIIFHGVDSCQKLFSFKFSLKSVFIVSISYNKMEYLIIYGTGLQLDTDDSNI